MKKRLLKVAVATALTVAFAVPAFANPFSDVPAKHWAYDSVNKLAQAGIVDGYADGTFKGEKTMTRYEMAQVVAKAMNKSLNAEQQATVDQLAKEFSTELNNLGVKVEGLQNQVDNMVKISGDARVRYFSNDGAANDRSVTDYRARVSFDGKINDNMKFNARLSSYNALADAKANTIALDTANVTVNGLGMTNTIGRQDIKLGSGFLMDNQMNGIAAQAGGLKMFAGNVTSNAKVEAGTAYADGKLAAGDAAANVWNRAYGAEYNTNVYGAKLNLAYMNNKTSQDEIYGANTSFKLADGVTATAEYFKNAGEGKNDATAKAYGVKFDKVGLSATYRDVEQNALTPFSTIVTNTNTQYSDLQGGFKGMEYQFDKNLDKNANFTVKYQDFEKQDGTKIEGRTSAAVNVKF